MALVSDIINQSFSDLGVTKPGETVSPTIQGAAFLVLQQMWMSWAREQLLSILVQHGGGVLQAGVTIYAIGNTGSGAIWGSGPFKPVRITGWTANDSSSSFSTGGSIISFEQLHEVRKNMLGRYSVLPEYVAADQGQSTAGGNSSIAIQIYPTPPPIVAPGNLTLDYYCEPAQLTSINFDLGVNLPIGYEAALHYNLAIALAPQYARVGGVPETLAANAANALQFIRDRNAKILGLQQAQPVPAPQQ